MSHGDRRRLRQEIQYIFQDPFASLDPRHTVGYSIAEPIVVHGLIKDRKGASSGACRNCWSRSACCRSMPSAIRTNSPAASASASASRGRWPATRSSIIADESVSALDVSIQAQIVNLLMELQEKRRLSYLFITHDMAVVEKISHRVAVMYLGQIVELGSRQAIFENPQHSYTRKLLAAVPIADPQRERAKMRIEGEIPSPVRPVGQEPAIHRMREVEPGHWVAIEADQLRGAA